MKPTQINFEPKLGVVVYEGDGRHYLQVHDIIKSAGGYYWGEGKPFQREQLQELALSLKKEQLSTLKLRGLIQENLLYFQPGLSGNVYAWFLPPQQHFITFTPDMKIPAAKYRFPGLILAVKNKDMFIFAYKGKTRPTGKTALFHAPFNNIYDDGEVCMGTISESRRQPFLEDEIDRWQRRFFGGRFTSAHDVEDHLAKGFTLQSLYKTMKTAFPEKALKPAKYKTLDLFIKSLAAGGDDE